jgi:hypothetical protein
MVFDRRRQKLAEWLLGKEIRRLLALAFLVHTSPVAFSSVYRRCWKSLT